MARTVKVIYHYPDCRELICEGVNFTPSQPDCREEQSHVEYPVLQKTPGGNVRITFIIDSMKMGGAERFMATITNYFASRGHEITLITFKTPDEDFFELHPQIKRAIVGLTQPSSGLLDRLKNTAKRILRLRQFIQDSQPQVVVSFMEVPNILTLFATRGLNLPVVISENTDPRYHPLETRWQWGRRLSYRFADVLVILSEAIRPVAETLIEAERIHVIPHPAGVKEVPHNSLPRQKIIIGMGRLVESKQFGLLLKAFAMVQRPDWKLCILGEGSERENLMRLAQTLNINVALPGAVYDPLPLLQQASLFVMTSRYEGFPLALVEAMTCGLPSISFDCPSGPREIIRHEIDGLLVPPQDIDRLAQAMRRLMENHAERQRMSERAVEVIERFQPDKIMAQWEQLFYQVCRG